MSTIKRINQAIEKFFSDGMSEAGKARIVANIEKANSKEYQFQVACHHITNQVIDDMLNDPFWVEVIAEAREAGTL